MSIASAVVDHVIHGKRVTSLRAEVGLIEEAPYPWWDAGLYDQDGRLVSSCDCGGHTARQDATECALAQLAQYQHHD